MKRQLKSRTKKFAVDVFNFCDSLPDHPKGWVIGKQLMRSASSVGANDRAACRAQSRPAFIAKMTIVEEEAGESLFWMEMPVDLDMVTLQEIRTLTQEARELLAIATASKKTARRNS